LQRGRDVVEGLIAQGDPADSARAMLSMLVDQQSVMLATLDMSASSPFAWALPRP